MPEIMTGEKEVDRKLHSIIGETSRKITDIEELAKKVRAAKPKSFMYLRQGQPRVANVNAIERYIRFAVQASLLDERLQPTKAKSQIRSHRKFQAWLGSKAIDYLKDNQCSTAEIKAAVVGLLGEKTTRVPSVGNVHSKLRTDIKLADFRMATRIVSVLRSKGNFRVKSHPCFLIPGVFRV